MKSARRRWTEVEIAFHNIKFENFCSHSTKPENEAFFNMFGDDTSREFDSNK